LTGFGTSDGYCARPANETVTVKHIYLSPHSDDVALSCGGEIISNSASKNDTVILNVFTSEQSDSDAARKGEPALFDSLNAERTLEDKSAWDSIGIECRYLNLPEALLRRRFPFQIRAGSRDLAIENAAYDAILSHVGSHPGANFYFPAGIGNHVDHLVCKEAGFRLLDEGVLDKIFLYEDVPYSWLRFIRNQYYRALLKTVEIDQSDQLRALRQSGEGLIEYLTRKSVPFPRGKRLFPIVYFSSLVGNRLRPHSRSTKSYRASVRKIELSDDELRQKKDLLYFYRSQIPMLFGTHADQFLHSHRDSFSTEMKMEVTRSRSTD
jgi:LmbE family N-acetylglucosaminyl deacetylase